MITTRMHSVLQVVNAIGLIITKRKINALNKSQRVSVLIKNGGIKKLGKGSQLKMSKLIHVY